MKFKSNSKCASTKINCPNWIFTIAYCATKTTWSHWWTKIWFSQRRIFHLPAKQIYSAKVYASIWNWFFSVSWIRLICSVFNDFVVVVVIFTNNLFYSLATGSPWSVFDNWHLKEQYKRSTNRTELSQQLSKNILYAGLINLALVPVTVLFAAIFCVFSYGDVSWNQLDCLAAILS